MNKSIIISTRPARGRLRVAVTDQGRTVHFVQAWNVYRDDVRLPDIFVGKTAAGALYGVQGATVLVIARNPAATSRAVAFGAYRRADKSLFGPLQDAILP
jgi:hypothetical protein